MRLTSAMILPGAVLLAGSAAAATADVTVTVPRLDSAGYHKPYVAIWLQQPGATTAKTLAVWYDSDNREEAGQKWLRDLRSWWRKSGRELKMPVSGITGATRAPGPQKVALNLGAIAPGAYELAVEASREDGGRELVTLPFTWDGKAARAAGSGKTELGAVSAAIRP